MAMYTVDEQEGEQSDGRGETDSEAYESDGDCDLMDLTSED